jgi:hypothetical protein
MDKDQKPDKGIVVGTAVAMGIAYTDTPPAPPLPGYVSPFKSVQEWLFYVCDTAKPEVVVEDIQFGLVEYPDGYMLSVVGYYEVEVSFNAIAHRLTLKPGHPFFPLPKEYYQNLSKQQLREKIQQELTEFIGSKTFQQSVLAKAETIKLNFVNGPYIRLKG